VILFFVRVLETKWGGNWILFSSPVLNLFVRPLSWWLWLRNVALASWKQFARVEWWFLPTQRERCSCRALEFTVSAWGGAAAAEQFYALPGNSPTIKRAFTLSCAHFHQVINRKQHSLSVCASQLYELQSVSSSEWDWKRQKVSTVERAQERVKFLTANSWKFLPAYLSCFFRGTIFGFSCLTCQLMKLCSKIKCIDEISALVQTIYYYKNT
jgi:hypothetical protein